MARTAETESVGIGQILKIGPWWHFRWTDESGKRLREALKVKDKKAARKKAQALSAAIEHGTWVPRRDRKHLSFAAAAAEFVDHVAQTAARTGGIEYTATTAEGYRCILRRMIGEARVSRLTGRRPMAAPFSDLHVGAITPDQIDSYLNARQDRDGIALATRNRELAFIKAVFSWVHDTKGLPRNPAERVKIVNGEALDPRRKQAKALTEIELERLLLVLAERGGLVYDVVLAAADTGLRAGSLRQLRWMHVDWHERLLRLPTSKGKKSLELPLSTRLLEHLKSMYDRARAQKINGTVVLTLGLDERPLFPSRADATKPFNNVWRGLNKAAKEAGLGHVHLHQLRHSYCTHAANAGVPSFVLKEQMGHRRLATTEKYYHGRREQSRQAIVDLEQSRQRATTAQQGRES